jgi:hypothetical protein
MENQEDLGIGFSDIHRDQTKSQAQEMAGLQLTQHAWERMCRRRITPGDVCAALDYGQIYQTRGALIYALGKKAVEQCRGDRDEVSRLDGLQVVCSYDGRILTAYRNKDLRRLKPRKSRRKTHLVNRRMVSGRRDTFRRLNAR